MSISQIIAAFAIGLLAWGTGFYGQRKGWPIGRPVRLPPRVARLFGGTGTGSGLDATIFGHQVFGLFLIGAALVIELTSFSSEAKTFMLVIAFTGGGIACWLAILAYRAFTK